MAHPPALGNSCTDSGRFHTAAMIGSLRIRMMLSRVRQPRNPGPARRKLRRLSIRVFFRPQALPINMPAANTSAPPSTTWKIARLQGVSIQWFWIQAMAQSSTKTTAMATEVAMVKSGMR